MRANDERSAEALRHGAYLCVSVTDSQRGAAASVPLAELGRDLGLSNEFESNAGHPADAIAFLHRVSATAAHIPDDGVLWADAVVHVASANETIVTRFCDEATRLLAPVSRTRVLAGVVRPTVYTGNAMYNFAYAHQIVQQPGTVMPNGILLPMCKSPAWWQKGWMERHTYFLPTYDDGRLVHEGHALAAEQGVACLMRRTYKHEAGRSPEGSYDFINYFECSDPDLRTFQRVCAALRDLKRNPEWKFVREGPMWHGRRVPTYAQAFEVQPGPESAPMHWGV